MGEEPLVVWGLRALELRMGASQVSNDDKPQRFDAPTFANSRKGHFRPFSIRQKLDVTSNWDTRPADGALVESISWRTLAALGPKAKGLGLLSSPLVVLGKHLKLIRDRLVSHASSHAKQGPRRIQIFLARHDRLRDQFLELLHGTTRSSSNAACH
jgi:hypothetical protein